MRRADVFALFFTVLWFGGNATLAFAAMTWFPLAKIEAVEVTTLQLGELFGLLFHRWVYVSSGLLGLLLPALLLTLWLRLSRKQQRITSGIQLALTAAVLGLHVAGSRLVLAAVGHWQRWEAAADDTTRAEAWQAFSVAHAASTKMSGYLTVALFLLAMVLAVTLARRAPSAPAAGA